MYRKEEVKKIRVENNNREKQDDKRETENVQVRRKERDRWRNRQEECNS